MDGIKLQLLLIFSYIARWTGLKGPEARNARKCIVTQQPEVKTFIQWKSAPRDNMT